MGSSVLRALIFGCFLGLLGATWSTVLHEHGLTDKDEVWMENVFTGSVAGALVFFYLEERRRRTENRMEEIAFLNHHIRNALTAINLSRYAGDDSVRLEIVADASRRIETTLRKMSEQEHVSLDPSNPNEDRPQ
jgi:metal-responsive CopG/Arc/MetJ family transcriptional regulator